jgi:hypothetical protein
VCVRTLCRLTSTCSQTAVATATPSVAGGGKWVCTRARARNDLTRCMQKMSRVEAFWIENKLLNTGNALGIMHTDLPKTHWDDYVYLIGATWQSALVKIYENYAFDVASDACFVPRTGDGKIAQVKVAVEKRWVKSGGGRMQLLTALRLASQSVHCSKGSSVCCNFYHRGNPAMTSSLFAQYTHLQVRSSRAVL